MSRELRLPSELDAFIQRPGPLTMVIRGPPGSGKTTLALAMLDAFQGRRFFVTGRRSRSNLLLDYPWLGTSQFHRIEVVDALYGPSVGGNNGGGNGAAPEASAGEIAREVREHAPKRISSGPVPKTDLERSIARDLGELPTGVRAVLAGALSQEPSMIVVDSWDAFVEEYMDVAPPGLTAHLSREELERAILRLAGRGASHVVMVLERSAESQLDYLVDGIVTTRHETTEGHPERWISLPKLRGIRIDSESYPYTLEGAKFKCVAPEPAHRHIAKVLLEPDPAPEAGALWPGAQAYESAFGRLREGELTVLESDPQVTDAAIETLTFPMIASALKGGGRLLYEPSPAQRLTDLWEAFEGQFTAEQFHRQVRIVAPGATLPEGHPLAPCLVRVPPRSITSVGAGSPSLLTQIPKAREFVTTTEPGRPMNLAIFTGDALRLVAGMTGTDYTPEGLPVMVKSYAIAGPIHLVFIAPGDDPLLSSLRMLATTQLGLRHRSGRSFVIGLRPVTPTYALAARTSDEARAYNLLRLV